MSAALNVSQNDDIMQNKKLKGLKFQNQESTPR